MSKKHKYLTIEEREQLAIMLAAGKSRREIAKALDRSHTFLACPEDTKTVVANLASA